MIHVALGERAVRAQAGCGQAATSSCRVMDVGAQQDASGTPMPRPTRQPLLLHNHCLLFY